MGLSIRLQDDVLLSRAGDETIMWKWLGYDRYFSPGKDRTQVPNVIKADVEDSR
jgi:hypothetical protein